MPEIYADTNPLIPFLTLGLIQASFMLASFVVGFFFAIGTLSGAAYFWFRIRNIMLARRNLDKHYGA